MYIIAISEYCIHGFKDSYRYLQQCILEQVKEKEKLKQMDREKKIHEELQEEKKLKSQLDRMQNQNDQEQKNKYQKQVINIKV